jgi:DNA-binding NtrC family response regulator
MILVSDPDLKLVYSAVATLEASFGARYEVVGTTHAEEAVEIARSERPQVLVLGGKLASKRALELGEPWARPRVIVLLPAERAAEAATLRAAGVHACLVMPFTREALAAEIAEQGPLAEVEAEKFAIVVAHGAERTRVASALEEHGRGPVLLAENAEVALALARSRRASAVYVVEPLAEITAGALFEYLRAEGVATPVVRVGTGHSPHPSVFTLIPAFGRAELDALAAALLRPAPLHRARRIRAFAGRES